MTIAETLLPELDHENGVTRRLLARFPEARHEWRPHARSFSAGQLATHLVNLATWGRLTLETSQLELESPQVQALERAAFTSRADALATFDEDVRRIRAALASATDAELLAPWTLYKGGTAMFTMPKVSVLRMFVMNHAVHHRGQLSVYLRLLDVPVPAMYGPSADER